MLTVEPAVGRAAAGVSAGQGRGRHISPFLLLLALALLARFVAVTFVDSGYDPAASSYDVYSWGHKDLALSVNLDEYEMLRTARYVEETGAFLTDSAFGRPNFRASTPFVTAFRPKGNVALHVIGIKLSKWAGSSAYRDDPVAYMRGYGLTLCILKTLLFTFSVLWFHRLAGVLLPPRTQRVATLAYVLNPPIFFYVGRYDILENVALPILVIVASFLAVESVRGRSEPWPRAAGVGLLALGAGLLRPHALAILAAMAGALAGRYVWHRLRGLPLPPVRSPLLLLGILALGHVPLLWSNHRDFGGVFLSTQPGLELYQGHNPFARGSWAPHLFRDHPDYFRTVLDSARLSRMDEKAEMEFYRSLAVRWIAEHPAQEAKLALKKLALFFWPDNYLNKHLDPFTLLVHLGFIGWVAAVLRRRITVPGGALVVIAVPVLGAVALYVVFFAGERWRYYADPFMLLGAVGFYHWLFLLARGRNPAALSAV